MDISLSVLKNYKFKHLIIKRSDFLNKLLFGEIELLIRLVSAVVLGGIIGFERGGTKHAAGLRTHTILCLGAASIMVVSESLVNKYNIPSEIMRMGAQIISGVGFLGAGGIIMSGGQLHGITTAAGLWTTACVGIAVGSGNYLIAIFMVFLMMLVMLGFRSVSQKIRTESTLYSIRAEAPSIQDVEKLMNEIISNGFELCSTHFEYCESGSVLLNIDVKIEQKSSIENCIKDITLYGKILEFTVQ